MRDRHVHLTRRRDPRDGFVIPCRSCVDREHYAADLEKIVELADIVHGSMMHAEGGGYIVNAHEAECVGKLRAALMRWKGEEIQGDVNGGGPA